MKSEEHSENNTRARVARGRARALCARTLRWVAGRYPPAVGSYSGLTPYYPLPMNSVHVYSAYNHGEQQDMPGIAQHDILGIAPRIRRVSIMTVS